MTNTCRPKTPILVKTVNQEALLSAVVSNHQSRSTFVSSCFKSSIKNQFILRFFANLCFRVRFLGKNDQIQNFAKTFCNLLIEKVYVNRKKTNFFHARKHLTPYEVKLLRIVSNSSQCSFYKNFTNISHSG